MLVHFPARVMMGYVSDDLFLLINIPLLRYSINVSIGNHWRESPVSQQPSNLFLFWLFRSFTSMLISVSLLLWWWSLVVLIEWWEFSHFERGHILLIFNHPSNHLIHSSDSCIFLRILAYFLQSQYNISINNVEKTWSSKEETSLCFSSSSSSSFSSILFSLQFRRSFAIKMILFPISFIASVSTAFSYPYATTNCDTTGTPPSLSLLNWTLISAAYVVFCVCEYLLVAINSFYYSMVVYEFNTEWVEVRVSSHGLKEFPSSQQSLPSTSDLSQSTID